MINFFRKNRFIILIVLFVVSILPFFWKAFEIKESKKVKGERFTSELSYLNSMDKLTAFIDGIYNSTHRKDLDTALYVQIASENIKERFSFGLSHYSVSENWIAALSGKVLWPHFSAIVDPDDILKHSEGLCSQQSIVFMEVLKRKGINVRSVGLGDKKGPGHFLCEAHYNNSWRLHDVTKEPQWQKISNHHESMDYYQNYKDSLYVVYQYRMPKVEFDKIMTKVVYGNVNDFPAKNMLLFHRITFILTYVIPLILLLLAIRFRR